MATNKHDDVNDTSGFFSSPPPSVKFDSPGDTARGEVVTKELRQQTDLDTGDPLVWSDGRPRMQLVVTIRVSPESDDDEGLRNLYVRANMRQAVIAALKLAKQSDLTIGDTLSVTYTGDDKPAKRGVQGAKLYTATVNEPDTPSAKNGGQGARSRAATVGQSDEPPF